MVQYKKILATDVTGNADIMATTALGAEYVSYAIKTTIGATPTVTVTLEGSMDGENWKVLDTKTITTATVTFGYYLVSTAGIFVNYKLKAAANTNVTIKATNTVMILHGHSQSDY